MNPLFKIFREDAVHLFQKQLVPALLTEADFSNLSRHLATWLERRTQLVGGIFQYIRALHCTDGEILLLISRTMTAVLSLRGYATSPTAEGTQPDTAVVDSTRLVALAFANLVTSGTEAKAINGDRGPWILGVEYYREDRIVDALVVTRADTQELLVDYVQSGYVKEIIRGYAAAGKGRGKYAELQASGAYWFHVLHDKDLASRPQEVFGGPSLEDNLSTALPEVWPESFFNIDGLAKENMPEPWMLEAGCY